MTTTDDPANLDVVEARSCPRCGYDLRGLDSTRCPECGLPFDLNAIPAANVPWLRRKHLGLLTAYYMTVFRVLAHPIDFGDQVWRVGKIDVKEAEAFARCTVFIATISMTAAMCVYPLAESRQGVTGLDLLLIALVILPSAYVYFRIATLRLGLDPSAGTRVHLERFALMQHFGCAGLGLAPLLPLAVLALGVINIIRLSRLGSLLLAAVGAAIILCWWIGGIMFHRFGGRFSVIGTLKYAIVVLFLWLWAFVASVVIAFIVVVTVNMWMSD